MKMFFLNVFKPKTEKVPSLKSLHPPFYNIKLAWFSNLSLFVLIFLITAFVGFKLAYNQYFENYKELQSIENYDDLINIERLKNVVNQRKDFLNQTFVLPKDPSL